MIYKALNCFSFILFFASLRIYMRYHYWPLKRFLLFEYSFRQLFNAWYPYSSHLLGFFFNIHKWHTQTAHFFSLYSLYVPSAYFVEHTRLVLHIKRKLADILFSSDFFILSFSVSLSQLFQWHTCVYVYIFMYHVYWMMMNMKGKKKTNTTMPNIRFTKSHTHKYWLRFFFFFFFFFLFSGYSWCDDYHHLVLLTSLLFFMSGYI